ncbi:MAG TPA: hypothetical protein PLE14_04290 [Anaerolineales bacterium]|nr:hypothetical protein [Anaerolineales bacterium]HNO30358.1 hypothetical protein [Anaerolineales bacterium]
MSNLKTQVAITMSLGILSLIAGLLAHLALTDIFHAEPDVSLEWNVVRLCAAIIAAFVISAILLLKKIYRLIQVEKNSS